MPPSLDSAYVAAAQATDTRDLLNHIAWTDVILPRLERYKSQLSTQLVSLTLGRPGEISREQVAGILAGIDFIKTLFERILRDGEKALRTLKDYNVNLS